MAEEIQGLICLDTSVLVDHFRKKNNDQTFFFKLSNNYKGFAVSVVVQYEVYSGSTSDQIPIGNNLFEDFFIIPYSTSLNTVMISIEEGLKKTRRSIEFKDLIIAASSALHKITLATINKKHFKDIDGLQIITPDSL